MAARLAQTTTLVNSMALSRSETIEQLERLLRTELGKAINEFQHEEYLKQLEALKSPCKSMEDCLTAEYAKGVAFVLEDSILENFLAQLKIQEGDKNE